MALGAPKNSPDSGPTAKPNGSQVPTHSQQFVLSGDRPVANVHFESEMVSFFVEAATLLGVPKSVAAVYGIVFASPGPLSFSEISARLNFSNGSISQALRVLREIGAVRAVDSVGGAATARERFVPDLALRKLVGRFIEQRLEKQIDTGLFRLKSLERLLPNVDKVETAELTRRINCLHEWHKRASHLVPVVRTTLRTTS